jgi:hypothetical protein
MATQKRRGWVATGRNGQVQVFYLEGDDGSIAASPPLLGTGWLLDPGT